MNNRIFRVLSVIIAMLFVLSAFMACDQASSTAETNPTSNTQNIDKNNGGNENNDGNEDNNIKDDSDISSDGGEAIVHEWLEATCTEPKKCKICQETEGVPNGHSFNGGAVCGVCGMERAYLRIDSNGTQSETGEYILFGAYPQSEVTDTALKNSLTELAGTLPTSSASAGWTSYGYYKSGKVSDYMWYIDVTRDGEMYRGVYFTSYRPYFASISSSKDYSYQDNNGYKTRNVYWFKYEPIKWRILTQDGSNALILSELLLDAQEYQVNNVLQSGHWYAANGEERLYHDKETGKLIISNSYKHSAIRNWLNDEFYNTAFGELQKEIIQLTMVDNSVLTTSPNNSYVSDNTEDNVFLLSYADITNESYGFNSDISAQDTARQKLLTDYAICQGASKDSQNTNSNVGDWRLRSPCSEDYGRCVSYIDYNGSVGSQGVVYNDGGVCPAMWICLQK